MLRYGGHEMAETPGMDDGVELVASMGWEPLPYGCVGMARNAETRAGRLWSWLILVPWAVNDSKPWVDGSKLISDPTKAVTEQRAEVLAEMREILDQRYGETVAGSAADDFLRRLQEE